MYVVRCADGTLYTGYSPDVEARVAAHNAGRGAKYTKTRLPVELVASAAFATRALEGERFEVVLADTFPLIVQDDSSSDDQPGV